MKIKSIDGFAHTFTGKVLVSDPCYLVPNEFWSDFCDVLFKKEHDTLFQLDKTIIFVHHTAFGDGFYPVIKNEETIGRAAVDAGLLSIIPMAFAKKHKFDRWDLVTVIDGGLTESLGNGNFKCGDYSIITDGSDEEEENE